MLTGLEKKVDELSEKFNTEIVLFLYISKRILKYTSIFEYWIFNISKPNNVTTEIKNTQEEIKSELEYAEQISNVKTE